MRIASNTLINKVNYGDLIWFRDFDGIYYLGKIIGEWKYVDDEIFKCADLINVRPAER